MGRWLAETSVKPIFIKYRKFKLKYLSIYTNNFIGLENFYIFFGLENNLLNACYYLSEVIYAHEF